jgi:hypothetical protein
MINRIIHAKIHIAWHISPRGLRPSGSYGATRADMPCDMDFSMCYSLYIILTVWSKLIRPIKYLQHNLYSLSYVSGRFVLHKCTGNIETRRGEECT